ncbi:hypothetical protein NC653_039496 [Populus alba x Populus x berolinensis]|uniref:Uncharacterized protein n=1 Tax=Populus alba x Populus x berolinensis TaxID=444605 RepID=A0AAD6LC14_9ROSI|nr:hypothetical protein NC653_039496 [Populus alba x Populus x berolinensis]
MQSAFTVGCWQNYPWALGYSELVAKGSFGFSFLSFLETLLGKKRVGNHKCCCREPSLAVGMQAWPCLFVFSAVCGCDLAAMGFFALRFLFTCSGFSGSLLCCVSGVVSEEMACNHNRALNGKPNLLGPLSFGSIGRAAAFSVGLDILSLKNSVPLPLAGLLVLSGGLLGCVALYSFKHLIRLFWVVPSSVLPHCNQLLFLLQYQVLTLSFIFISFSV